MSVASEAMSIAIPVVLVIVWLVRLESKVSNNIVRISENKDAADKHLAAMKKTVEDDRAEYRAGLAAVRAHQDLIDSKILDKLTSVQCDVAELKGSLAHLRDEKT